MNAQSVISRSTSAMRRSCAFLSIGSRDVLFHGVRACHRAVHTATTAAAAHSASAHSPRRRNLLGLPLEELARVLRESPLTLPAYRAKQLAHAMYHRGEADFAAMTNLSRAHREELDRLFVIDYGTLVKESTSTDHTRKFLIGFDQSAKSKLLNSPPPPPAAIGDVQQTPPLDCIECVFIPMGSVASRSAPRSGAVCISSQIGCTLTCSFCATGAMSKSRLRNLTTAEIVGQVMLTKHALGDFRLDARGQLPQHRCITNIVAMGMGEPLLNYRNLRGAFDILTSHPRAGLGLGLGRPKITLSTSGVAPMLDQLLADYGGNIALAISLHAVTDELRNELVPINKQYNLNVLLEAVRRYQNGRVATGQDETSSDEFTPPTSAAGRRRVTFEYVMLKGVNDSLSEARQLVRLLHDIDSLVNLIPFNPWEGSKYETSTRAQIEAFASVIEQAGVACTVRWPRGRDIDGACGQLAVKQQQQI